MDTDTEWEKWGERDPYFAVLTDPKFRSANLSDEARREFFDSGRLHVNHVLDACQRYVNPQFSRGSVLDFGCGTGRLALPFAEQFEHVTAVDVSQAMLREARRNAEAAGLKNITWLPSDDSLSAVQGRFDLVHSVITCSTSMYPVVEHCSRDSLSWSPKVAWGRSRSPMARLDCIPPSEFSRITCGSFLLRRQGTGRIP